MKTQVNVGIEVMAKAEALRLGLSFSECLEFGLAFKAAEAEDCDYPSNLLSKKLEKLSERLGEALRQLESKGLSEKSGEKNFREGLEPNMYPEDCYGN